MTMKKKKLPSWLENPLLVSLYQSKFGILVSNWLNQGMTYMLVEELFVKLCFEFVIFVFIFSVCSIAGVSVLTSSLISCLVAHTLNWLLNGHFFNLIRYFGFGKKNYEWFITYPNKIRGRLVGKRCVSGVALYGSLSRGLFSENSDLDVRVIARRGIVNAVASSLLVLRERLCAFFARYPIDIFMVTQKRGLEKLRSDEPPVILIDHDGFIVGYYHKVFWFESLIIDRNG